MACGDDDGRDSPAAADSRDGATAAGDPFAPVSPSPATGASATLAPTPACGDDDDADDPTPPQTAGPFFTPNSPERTSLLEPGMPGTKLVLAGRVLSTACQPLSGALIDFWQTDDAGEYDNAGFRLRGHQFTDSTGRYRLETILPGLYTGRTRHIHVKVQAANRPLLTTQLYFEGEPGNGRDGIFSPDLAMALRDAGGAKEATFDFVLRV
ncbi:MAG: intradiol ring-cleavage dioxygenase [Tepidiformaceae bacterium]